MQRRAGWNITFLIDLALILAAGPPIFFPGMFPAWALWPALLLLVGGWFIRRAYLGAWRAPTAADLPLLLFAAMLPVAVWAAPDPLRGQYALPRALILLWNLALFVAVATHCSRSAENVRLALVGLALAGVGIAAVAPFGMNWLYKFAGMRAVLDTIPAPLVGVFSGAESGFHPNQVAGTLLSIAPLLLALSARELRPVARSGRAGTSHRMGFRMATTLAATLVTVAILVLTQSRSGLLGLAVGALVMLLLPSRWGRRALAAAALLFVALLPVFPGSLIDFVADAPGIEALGRTNTLGFRQEVWAQSVAAIRSVPWTGLGLGTFRDLLWALYPIDFSHTRKVFHAHNFFLQTALDLGVPGLIALLGLYLTAAAQVVFLWTRPSASLQAAVDDLPWRTLALGFAGILSAQVVYGLLDAVAMGAKTNFVFWYVIALLMGIANLGARCVEESAGLR